MGYIMFKKGVSKCIFAMVLITSSTVHAASDFEHTQYSLGVELSVLNRTRYSSEFSPDLNSFRASNSTPDLVIRKNRMGFNFLAVAQFIENLGMEVGYGYIVKVIATAQGNNQASNKISNTYIDALGFLPVATRVQLIGAFGIGFLRSNANVTNVTIQSIDDFDKAYWGFRYGGGASYAVNYNIILRGMFRYQQGNKYFLTSNTSLSLGVLYHF